MVVLDEGQYDLNGFRMGPGTDYYVQGLIVPGHKVRDADADHPNGPGLFFGSEWPETQSWILQLRMVGTSPADALAKYETLAGAWTTRGPEGFLGSVPLVFKRPGQVQRQTSPGRPRDLVVTAGRLRKTHVIDCDAIFATESPFEFSDAEHVVDLVRNGSNVTLGNAGNYPAPVVWDVYGEVTNPGVIRSEADRFDLTTAIGDLDYYRVRTDARTVTRASDAGNLLETLSGTPYTARWLEIPAGGALFRAVGSTPVSAAVKVRATWRDTWWS